MSEKPTGKPEETPAEPRCDRDKVLFLSPTTVVVHDEKTHELHVGECTPLAEGQPVDPRGMLIRRDHGAPIGEIVWRPGEGPAPKLHGGRSRASTDAYRRGWDATFGKSMN